MRDKETYGKKRIKYEKETKRELDNERQERKLDKEKRAKFREKENEK